MAHELGIHDQMMSGRLITPWHRLGEITETIEIPDLYRIMDWPTELVRCATVTGSMTDSYATERVLEDGGRIVLGTGLSKNYKILQNAELIKLIEPFVEQGCALETAGTLRDGKRVWIMLRLAKDLHVGKDDVIQKYIMVSNDHCGKQAARFGLVGIRVVCMNTLNAAEGSSASQIIRVLHQGDINENMKTVASLLDHVNGDFKNYGISLNALTKVGINEKDLRKYVKDCLFAHYTDKRIEKRDEQILKAQDKIVELFVAGDGSDLKSAKGTVYGAYQAVNNYLNHDKEIAIETRLPSLIWGQRAMRDKKAFALALKLAA